MADLVHLASSEQSMGKTHLSSLCTVRKNIAHASVMLWWMLLLADHFRKQRHDKFIYALTFKIKPSQSGYLRDTQVCSPFVQTKLATAVTIFRFYWSVVN